MIENPIARLETLAPQFLTIQESADTLGVSRRTVRRLIERGKLRTIPFKGNILIPVSEVSYYQLKKNQQRCLSSMYSRKNLFKGINPLLMSLLQTPGMGSDKSIYPSFHSLHIAHLTDFLNDQLPAEYRAMNTQSIQVLRTEDGEKFFPEGNFIPDISLYKSVETVPVPPQSSALQAATPALLLTLADTLPSSERFMTGVGIYKTGPHRDLGEPIVRFELLSPSNKPPYSDAKAYVENRRRCLEAGTNLVEIDYLHETKTPFHGVPVYPDNPHAQPYSLAVSCPSQNSFAFYPFGINQVIPAIVIPLEGEKQIVFDFNEVYQYNYEKGRWGELPAIDYEQEPLRMHTYSERDQQLIRDHLKSLKK